MENKKTKELKKDNLSAFSNFAKGKKVEKKKLPNCVIYTRVSTKDQEDNLSLITQKKGCEEYAKRKGYTVLEYFGGKSESAKTDERKEFNQMLTYLKKYKETVSYIIVYSLDRFSRSGQNAMSIVEDLQKKGIYVDAATQPTDTTTSSGKFQQDIQFIFSKFDNNQRKDKCMAGTKEALLSGIWCAKVPRGYNKVKANKITTITVNEEGKLLRKAFHWKAYDGLNNEQCRDRLETLGLKLRHQALSVIFRNPFYCGILVHNFLEGQVVDGTHEKLVSKEVFLRVQEILEQNPQGFKQAPEQDNVPLKVFLKCNECKKGLTGYIAKKKGLWYYKCRTKGCCNNKSAKMLNEAFQKVLSYFTLNQQYTPLLKAMLVEELKLENMETIENLKILKINKLKMERELENLERRYMKEGLREDLFIKYEKEYTGDLKKIMEDLKKLEENSSNLENDAEMVLEISENLNKTWCSSEYHEKRRLQNMLFPEGMVYDKQNDTVRTEKYNPLFLWITHQQQDTSQNKTGIPELNLTYAGLVAKRGVEPLTSGL